MVTGSSSEDARATLELLRSRPPTLGEGRLLCVDGPAGSGKTTLAAAVAARTPAPVVHMDELYDGWRGLDRVGTQLDTLLGPLSRGVPGSYRRYDWYVGRYTETVTVAPTELLVLEGVGSGSPGHAHLATVLVWVWAPSAARLRRGLGRDGEHLREQLLRWRTDEEAVFARDRTAERADLVVDTGGEGSSPLSG